MDFFSTFFSEASSTGLLKTFSEGETLPLTNSRGNSHGSILTSQNREQSSFSNSPANLSGLSLTTVSFPDSLSRLASSVSLDRLPVAPRHQLCYPCILHLWANTACLSSRERENEPLLSKLSRFQLLLRSSRSSPFPFKGGGSPLNRPITVH
ncbi:unnamed protein product [Acanthosepion pharaonis]|uniref:Uncharacterized protein n=1 Tax=Acanthosepion pharaonis TaxID=158019 RepID=A0A812DF65_ACAPH|nr:unnamed protein product [Sepia pharaonis]